MIVNDKHRQSLFDQVCQPTLDNEKYVLKLDICEVRQFSVICHVEAILEVFPN